MRRQTAGGRVPLHAILAIHFLFYRATVIPGVFLRSLFLCNALPCRGGCIFLLFNFEFPLCLTKSTPIGALLLHLSLFIIVDAFPKMQSQSKNLRIFLSYARMALPVGIDKLLRKTQRLLRLCQAHGEDRLLRLRQHPHPALPGRLRAEI